MTTVTVGSQKFYVNTVIRRVVSVGIVGLIGVDDTGRLVLDERTKRPGVLVKVSFNDLEVSSEDYDYPFPAWFDGEELHFIRQHHDENLPKFLSEHVDGVTNDELRFIRGMVHEWVKGGR
jgi:hypothetical protein